MKVVATLALALMAVTGLPVSAAAQATPKKIAIVLDTSSSMRGNDPARYVIMLSKIIGDLAGPRDEVALIRMPVSNETERTAQADASLILTLARDQQDAFKRALESVAFQTSTSMLTPLLTAQAWLGTGTTSRRLLIILTDADLLECCQDRVHETLHVLKQSGVTTATLGIGDRVNMAYYAESDLKDAVPSHEIGRLVGAAAQFYQQFIGGARVTTGDVHGPIELHIDPLVREAFVVIVADGPMRTVPRVEGPGAAAIDPNFRGGAETAAVGGNATRGYRIVRLTQPTAGRWTIVPDVQVAASYLLIQDYALEIRLLPTSTLSTGTRAVLKAQVFNTITNQPVTDPALLRGMKVTATIGGEAVTLSDDGTRGDQKAGDGIYSIEKTFDTAGDVNMTTRVVSGGLDRSVFTTLRVERASNRFVAELPNAVDSGEDVALKVRIESPNGHGPVPSYLTVSTPDGPVILKPVTGAPGSYEGRWRPTTVGPTTLRIEAEGMPTLEQPVEILGSFALTSPSAIALGPVRHGSEATAVLDLSDARIVGPVKVGVTTDLTLASTDFVLDDGAARPLGSNPQMLTLTTGGPRQFTLRLKGGDCPETCRASTAHALRLTVMKAGGRESAITVPLHVEVIGEPWLYCWRYELAAVGLMGVMVFIVRGLYAPSRFGRGLGVQVAVSMRLDEGVFYLIRAVRGSRSGFYRDARVFVTRDYRVTSTRNNAIARLRAERGSVMIASELGARVSRRSIGTTWEPLGDREAAMEPGVTYKAADDRLFFELRAQ
jgi:hypothetical protein